MILSEHIYKYQNFKLFEFNQYLFLFFFFFKILDFEHSNGTLQ